MSKELEMARELVKILEAQENTSRVELSKVGIGEIINANGNKYKVLDHFEDGTTLIVSDKLMLENTKFDSDSRDYNKSSLKKKIEDNCLPVFGKDFGKDNLVEHEVDLTSVDMQNEFGKCRCKVRPLTFDEARKYNDLLVKKALKDYYWTLTPWSTKERGWTYSITVVSPSGYINYLNYCNYDLGVRPVCILKSNIFVSVE